MNPELKPMKKLMTVALVLHIISLCIAVALYILQMPMRYFLFGGPRIPEEEVFVFLPPSLIALIAVLFILHCSLTVGFWKIASCAKNQVEKLRTLNVFSFIFVLAVFPIFGLILSDITLIGRNLAENDWIALTSLLHIISRALDIRIFAFAVFLIATSMSWYHCFIEKERQRKV